MKNQKKTSSLLDLRQSIQSAISDRIIEGWPVDEQQIVETILDAESNGERALLVKLAGEIEEGRPVLEAIDEFLTRQARERLH